MGGALVAILSTLGVSVGITKAILSAAYWLTDRVEILS